MNIKSLIKKVPGSLALARAILPPPRDWLLNTMPSGSVCAEIGVHEGDFSRLILDTVRPKRLHLIDPWKCFEEETYDGSWYGKNSGGQEQMDKRFQQVCDRFKKEIDDGTVVVHRALSDEAAGDFAESELDWVYIDGNHLYDFVMRDLELYDPKVVPGGYLTGDDYGIEGWWDNGVEKAVQQFVKDHAAYSLKVRGSQFIIKKG